MHRPSLSARLRGAIQDESSPILLVTGAPGSGKTYLVSEAFQGILGIHFCAAGLEDSHNRRLFVEELNRVEGSRGVGASSQRTAPAPAGQDWASLLERALSGPAEFVVLDGVGSFIRSNKPFLASLGAAWRRAHRRGPGPVLILVDRDRALLNRVNAKGSPFRDPMARATRAGDPGLWVELAPLPYSSIIGGMAPELARALDPSRVLRLAAAFGGRPAILRHLDWTAPLAVNYTRMVLDPEGPLWDEPLSGWQGDLKHVGRYGAVCAALADGARRWAELAEYMGQEASASSVGPYIKKLIALGRVVSRSSLDARRGGRGQRYHLADPFDALWWSAVLPARSDLESRRTTPAAAWRRIAQHALSSHMERTLPGLCREFLETASQRVLGATARDAGSLWGEGFDIPVAATLRNGAVVYGTCNGGPNTMTDVALDRLESHMRATRFGFGREARIRVLFSLSGFSEALSLRASRNPLVRLIGPAEMVDQLG